MITPTLPSFYTHVHAKGNQLFVRGVEFGKSSCRKIQYKPTLYITSTDEPVSGWKSIQEEPLKPMTFEDIYAAKDFIKQYQNVGGMKIFGLPRFMYTYLNEQFSGPIHHDRRYIRVVYLDIEVNSSNGFPHVKDAAEEVTAITAKDASGYHTFGCGPFVSDGSVDRVTYTQCLNEYDLLTKFLDFWTGGGQGQEHPDIVTGWNITGFDLPYLVKRIASVIGQPSANRLSPWGLVSLKDDFDKMGKETTFATIVGVSNLDYLELYRKFTYTQQESYKLDHIAFVELGERKKHFADYATLDALYRENHQLFIEYNIQDVGLVERLDAKMKLIDLALQIAYDARVNYEDVFTQVRLWDVMIHNYLYRQKIAVPITSGGHKEETFVGAYVKAPVPGRYEWVMGVDAAALYPNIIRMFNIGPDTRLNECHSQLTVQDILDGRIPAIDDDKCLAPSGWLFRTDKVGFLSEMMGILLEDRNAAKQQQLACERELEITTSESKKAELRNSIAKFKNIQLARKVQLNSAYGACGNEHFRHFDIKLATSITLAGQLLIKYAEKEINLFLNAFLGTTDLDYVIASDTDSLYLKMESVVQRLRGANASLTNDQIVSKLDTFGKTVITTAFKEMFTRLAAILHARDGVIVMKREAIANVGIWLAKKHYILNIYDNEGVRYAAPKLKMMGIQAVQSSTPASCRTAIMETIKLMLSSDEAAVQAYIADFKKTFNDLSFEEIAFSKGLSEISKYHEGSKGIPIHVRGAIAYNALLEIYQLKHRFDVIRDGEKVKYCYLALPNPIQSNVISAPSILPSEFKLDGYLDYDVQFQKTFLAPVQSILTVIGWNHEPRQTLESFFV
jgi:DNA polymerase elongation subunit (family B)